MSASPSTTVFAWLLTYLIQSTVLLGAVWLVTRRGRLQPAAADLLWKVALIAPLITGPIQSSLQLRTTAAVRLPVAAQTRESGIAGSSTPTEAQAPSSTASVPSTAGTTPHSRLPTPTTVVVVLWAVVALGSSLYYFGRRLILVGRLADRRAVAGGPLSAMLVDLKREVGLHRTVRLTMARTISSPVALGVAEICIPELALSDLTPDQQRSMLAHELAHLARHDSLWLAAASLIERLFFFQPLNRLARQELETTAEYLSDEWAMQKTGSAVALAKCLATVAEWIQASPLGVPVAGFAERRSLLVSRISRLLEQKLPTSPASRTGWIAAAAVGVMVTIAAAPHVTQGIVISQDSTNPPSQSSERRQLQDTSSVVPALIARLKDDDAGVRRAAAQSLGRLGDRRAVQPLITVLADPEAEVRRSAIEALSDLEDPAAIGPIAGLLKDSDTDVKKEALNALGHFDQKIPTTGVVDLLDDPSADVRHEAVNLLQNVHDRSAAPAIAKLIHDQSSDVREAVINALGDLGDQSSATAITGALTDPSGDVRQQALNALENLHAPVAEATLLNLLKDSNPDVREKAAQMAGNRSVVAAIPALRTLISDPRRDVREAATEALGNIADPAARAALQAALNSPDPNVRRAAAEALGQDRNQ
ncbi:MAG TPA: HEAT repeat domain-containing protein [Gemmatimonadales bacterium]|nr:HEAT repeat domain-containing protein [Gemmatimonadales bacterium]